MPGTACNNPIQCELCGENESSRGLGTLFPLFPAIIQEEQEEERANHSLLPRKSSYC